MSDDVYDFLVIGAGISGCSIAHELNSVNYRVALCDKSGEFGKTSMTAGAFLTPKLNGGNYVGKVANDAYIYSINFYNNLNSTLLYKKGVTFYAKDKGVGDFSRYAEFMPFIPQNINKDSIMYDEGYIVDPLKVCNELLGDIKLLKLQAKDINKFDEVYRIDKMSFKNIVLATGYENLPYIDEPYLKVGKYSYGTMLDVNYNGKVETIYHSDIMYGKNSNNRLKLGSTHHLIDYSKASNFNKKRSDSINLINLAKDSKLNGELSVIKAYDGVRYSQKDFLPVIGRVVNSIQSLKKYPNILHGYSTDELEFYKNIYLFNSFGSHGFIYSPYFAKILVKNIINRENIDDKVSTKRLFYRYVRKVNEC